MININQKFLVEGYYSFKVTNANTGKERDVSDIIAKDHKNMVLDSGLNALGKTSIMDLCKVGTSNEAVVKTQTDLISPIATSSSPSPLQMFTGRQTESPYYSWGRKTYRFQQGTAAGNLAEVGVTNGDKTLFSRALIVDALGRPTVLTILEDEWLDVTYEVRFYQELTDKNLTVVLDGQEYAVVVRPANITGSVGGYNNFFNHMLFFQSATSQVSYYSGDIGAITSTPGGVVGNGNENATYSNYAEHSYERTLISPSGLDKNNLVGGIKSALVRTEKCSWQLGFTPAIPKDNFKILILNYTFTWGRHDPE